MRSSLVRMRSSLVVRVSDCQCTSCNGPGFDSSIRRHSGIWGAADETVLNIVWMKRKKIPPKNIKKKNSKPVLGPYSNKLENSWDTLPLKQHQRHCKLFCTVCVLENDVKRWLVWICIALLIFEYFQRSRDVNESFNKTMHFAVCRSLYAMTTLFMYGSALNAYPA